MKNQESAINGVKLASKILNIPNPEVSFYRSQDLPNKNITGMFIPQEHVIIFNTDWLLSSKPIEIFIACFHESRHAYQDYSVKNQINEDIKTLQKWEEEFQQYNIPIKNNDESKDNRYLVQEIEIDAIIFTHNKIKELFGISTIIPSAILNKINTNIID